MLTAAVPSQGLVSGDAGTVVHVYEDGRAFEVQFITVDAHTADVATVETVSVRPVTAREITPSREFIRS